MRRGWKIERDIDFQEAFNWAFNRFTLNHGLRIAEQPLIRHGKKPEHRGGKNHRLGIRLIRFWRREELKIFKRKRRRGNIDELANALSQFVDLSPRIGALIVG